MTAYSTFETYLEAAKEVVGNNFYSDAWRSTSFLIQLLGKMESYFGSLAESNPDTDLYTAEIAVSSALNLVSNSYNCPVDDERYEKVGKMYDTVINNFISEVSDDATADLCLLGGLSNFVGAMRVHSISHYIEETGPSESKFEMLKLAKRDEKAVELAIKAAADILLAD